MIWISDVIAPQLRNGRYLSGRACTWVLGHHPFAEAGKVLGDCKLVIDVCKTTALDQAVVS